MISSLGSLRFSLPPSSAHLLTPLSPSYLPDGFLPSRGISEILEDSWRFSGHLLWILGIDWLMIAAVTQFEGGMALESETGAILEKSSCGNCLCHFLNFRNNSNWCWFFYISYLLWLLKRELKILIRNKTQRKERKREREREIYKYNKFDRM